MPTDFEIVFGRDFEVVFAPVFIWVMGVVGLIFGSFANVVIYRVPKGLSVVKPPSACVTCGTRLRAWELLPVISWLFLCGKCHACKAKISLRYSLVELLCGVLFATMAWYAPLWHWTRTDRLGYQTSFSVVPLAVWAFILITIASIDAETQLIPDGLVLTGAIAGLIFIAGGIIFPENFPSSRTWYDALLGVAAGAVPLFIIDRITLLVLKKDGFGYGDVKLMAMSGLFLGWRLMLVTFFIAFLLATLYIVFLAVRGRARRGIYMAFGPFLVAGTLVAFFLGENLFEMYFEILGGTP